MSTSSRTSPPALAPRTLTTESFDAKAERQILGHEEAQVVSALRAGSEDAFAKLIDRHHASMVRVARAYVPSNAVAEEVVQETWEAVITQLDRFERRSAVKTWIFRILINRAKSRGERERRTVPFSSLEKGESSGPTVDPTLFQGPDGEYPGHWAQAPRPWEDPERRLASLELRAELRAALERLPERQRLVVSLREVEGLPACEVCDLLGLSKANERVLLHRGRAALRRSLDPQLAS